MTRNTPEESLQSVRDWVGQRLREAAGMRNVPYWDVYEAVNVELLLVLRRLDLELEAIRKGGEG